MTNSFDPTSGKKSFKEALLASIQPYTTVDVTSIFDAYWDYHAVATLGVTDVINAAKEVGCPMSMDDACDVLAQAENKQEYGMTFDILIELVEDFKSRFDWSSAGKDAAKFNMETCEWLLCTDADATYRFSAALSLASAIGNAKTRAQDCDSAVLYAVKIGDDDCKLRVWQRNTN